MLNGYERTKLGFTIGGEFPHIMGDEALLYVSMVIDSYSTHSHGM